MSRPFLISRIQWSKYKSRKILNEGQQFQQPDRLLWSPVGNLKWGPYLFITRLQGKDYVQRKASCWGVPQPIKHKAIFLPWTEWSSGFYSSDISAFTVFSRHGTGSWWWSRAPLAWPSQLEDDTEELKGSLICCPIFVCSKLLPMFPQVLSAK